MTTFQDLSQRRGNINQYSNRSSVKTRYTKYHNTMTAFYPNGEEALKLDIQQTNEIVSTVLPGTAAQRLL